MVLNKLQSFERDKFFFDSFQTKDSLTLHQQSSQKQKNEIALQRKKSFVAKFKPRASFKIEHTSKLNQKSPDEVTPDAVQPAFSPKVKSTKQRRQLKSMNFDSNICFGLSNSYDDAEYLNVNSSLDIMIKEESDNHSIQNTDLEEQLMTKQVTIVN